jgi:putative endonuclease
VVADDHGTLVFVEVRARGSDAFGAPEESITRRKAQRMIACAQTYLAERAALHRGWRIDVIAIRLERGRLVRLDHYRHALDR